MIQEPYTFPNRHGPSLLLLKSNIGKSNQNVEHRCFLPKGKFYELYENDAVIANTQFDLKIAGGGRANMKLAGIPEMSFEYWAKEFISHGYKVAKVEQKESMLVKQMRGGATKEEKIIERELKEF